MFKETLGGEETIPRRCPESSSEAKDLFTSTRGKYYLIYNSCLYLTPNTISLWLSRGIFTTVDVCLDINLTKRKLSFVF